MTTAYRGTEDLRLTNEESLDVGVDTAKEEQQGQGQGAGAGQEGGSLPVLSSSITATDTTTSLMDSAQSVEQDNGEAGRNENELQRHRQQQQQEQDDETSASKPNENKAGDNDIDIDNYNDSKCSPTEPSSNANSNANSHEIQNPLTTTNFRRMAEETNSNADGSRSRSRSMKEYFNRESQLHEDVLTQRQSLPLTTTEELESEESGPTDGLPVYNVQVPPRMEDEWNPVRVALNIYKIKSIDIATARMNLNVWLRMTWKDPRLAWDPTDPRYLNITQTNYNADTDPEISEIWVPDLEMINQDTSLAETLAPKQATVYADGTVFWSRVGSLHVLCAFSGLKKHPFDHHDECSIDFSGWARSAYFADYQFMDPPLVFAETTTSGFTLSSAQTTYQEYQILPYESRATINYSYFDCCPEEPWPILTYTIAFERTTTPLYFRTLAVPTILMTFLGSTVFWLDIRCGERLGYGITVILAITTVEIIAADRLPTCPEWLWIEGLSFGSFVFAVLCLLESAYVTYVYYSQRLEVINVGSSDYYIDHPIEGPSEAFNDEDSDDEDGGRIFNSNLSEEQKLKIIYEERTGRRESRQKQAAAQDLVEVHHRQQPRISALSSPDFDSVRSGDTMSPPPPAAAVAAAAAARVSSSEEVSFFRNAESHPSRFQTQILDERDEEDDDDEQQQQDGKINSIYNDVDDHDLMLMADTEDEQQKQAGDGSPIKYRLDDPPPTSDDGGELRISAPPMIPIGDADMSSAATLGTNNNDNNNQNDNDNNNNNDADAGHFRGGFMGFFFGRKAEEPMSPSIPSPSSAQGNNQNDNKNDETFMQTLSPQSYDAPVVSVNHQNSGSDDDNNIDTSLSFSMLSSPRSQNNNALTIGLNDYDNSARTQVTNNGNGSTSNMKHLPLDRDRSHDYSWVSSTSSQPTYYHDNQSLMSQTPVNPIVPLRRRNLIPAISTSQKKITRNLGNIIPQRSILKKGNKGKLDDDDDGINSDANPNDPNEVVTMTNTSNMTVTTAGATIATTAGGAGGSNSPNHDYPLDGIGGAATITVPPAAAGAGGIRGVGSNLRRRIGGRGSPLSIKSRGRQQGQGQGQEPSFEPPPRRPQSRRHMRLNFSSLTNTVRRRRRRRQHHNSSSSSSHSKQKRRESDVQRWARERNLDDKNFDKVRQIDRFARRLFFVSYITFLFIMFSTLPLWRDDYSYNPPSTISSDTQQTVQQQYQQEQIEEQPEDDDEAEMVQQISLPSYVENNNDDYDDNDDERRRILMSNTNHRSYYRQRQDGQLEPEPSSGPRQRGRQRQKQVYYPPPPPQQEQRRQQRVVHHGSVRNGNGTGTNKKEGEKRFRFFNIFFGW